MHIVTYDISTSLTLGSMAIEIPEGNYHFGITHNYNGHSYQLINFQSELF